MMFNHESNELLREILHELRLIRHRLEPKFTLHIHRQRQYFHNGVLHAYSGETMAAIVAGSSGTFLLSATASDNSTPVLSAQTLTASDASVTVAADAMTASLSALPGSVIVTIDSTATRRP